MPSDRNRKTGLDFSVFSVGGTAFIGDIENAEVTIQNKTAEGKAVLDIDDFAVLTGRKTTFSGRMMVPNTGTAQLGALMTSVSPVGSVLITTGAGGGFSGTAVITEWKWRGAREEIQMVDISGEFRGSAPFA